MRLPARRCRAPMAEPHDPDAETEEDEMGLAVISGLVDDVEVTAGENGGLIRMSWPTTPSATLVP